ncbi:MAG: flagellar type III secretion system protein FlhB [Pseudomonadota bacterium]
MSEQDQGADKSYEATPQKLEDARKRGDIPKSQDVATAAAYFGLLIAISALGAEAIVAFGDVSASAFSRAETLAPRMLDGGDLSARWVAGGAGHLWPFFAAPAAFVLAAIFAQRAMVFAPEKIKPKLSRLSPIENAKHKFGITGLAEFAKSAVKLFAISGVLFAFLLGRTDEIIGLVRAEPRAAPSEFASLGVALFWRIAIIAAAIALIDLVWQRADHARKLRMTHEEVKEEHKRAEGDPMLKAQRRQRAEEIATNRMMLDVPKSDVVVVNPTHYAVALKWSRGVDAAPRVVAKGVDGVALRIREAAALADVPIHEDPPTARALEATVEIGAEISPQHYQAVAAAIRFAEAMRVKAKSQFGPNGSEDARDA